MQRRCRYLRRFVILLKNEMARAYMEAVVAWLEKLTQHLSGTVVNQMNPQSEYPVPCRDRISHKQRSASHSTMTLQTRNSKQCSKTVLKRARFVEPIGSLPTSYTRTRASWINSVSSQPILWNPITLITFIACRYFQDIFLASSFSIEVLSISNSPRVTSQDTDWWRDCCRALYSAIRTDVCVQVQRLTYLFTCLTAGRATLASKFEEPRRWTLYVLHSNISSAGMEFGRLVTRIFQFQTIRNTNYDIPLRICTAVNKQ